jgi:Ni2+-binding GTPase involved in maturation of urease and hydrogenase
MKLIIVAGTPGAGKTSVLIHTIKHLQSKNIRVSVVKIDCIYSEDAERFRKLGVPVLLGLSKDMYDTTHSSDHFFHFLIDYYHDGDDVKPVLYNRK